MARQWVLLSYSKNREGRLLEDVDQLQRTGDMSSDTKQLEEFTLKNKGFMTWLRGTR